MISGVRQEVVEMRVVTEVYHVYTYDELSKEAKEKVKEMSAVNFKKI